MKIDPNVSWTPTGQCEPQSIISAGIQTTAGREEEETKEKNTGRDISNFHGKRERRREEFLVLNWEEPHIHEVYMRILVLNPAPLILFIKWNSLPAAQPGFLLQQE